MVKRTNLQPFLSNCANKNPDQAKKIFRSANHKLKYGLKLVRRVNAVKTLMPQGSTRVRGSEPKTKKSKAGAKVTENI